MAHAIRCGVLAAVTATATGLAQSDRQLPDQAEFLQAVKSNLQGDRLQQRRYVYREKRIDVKRDDRGAVVSRSEKVFEVSPPVIGSDADRRLISVDGVPTRGADVERLKQPGTEAAAQREKRLREEAADQRKENAVVDDAFRVYNFAMEGRATLDGRDVIVFAFTPTSGVAARTSDGKLLQKFAGRAWIDERDRQLMRVDVESSEDVSFGLGILARLHKGSQIVFQRRPVDDAPGSNGPLWLPSELRYTGDGRLLLLKKLRVEGTREYSGYRPVRTPPAVSASGRTSGN